MPNKVVLKLTVKWADDSQTTKCMDESQVFMKKGAGACTDAGGTAHPGDEQELKILLDDQSDGNTVVLLDLMHGKPHYYFENPPGFPFTVSAKMPQTLMLKENMGLRGRTKGKCFDDDRSPYAQLIRFRHVDAVTGDSLDHCTRDEHTSVHVEC